MVMVPTLPSLSFVVVAGSATMKQDEDTRVIYRVLGDFLPKFGFETAQSRP